MRVRRIRKFVKPGTGELLTVESKQYYVTSDGMVYDGTRKRFLKQHEMSTGYMAVCLRDDNEKWHNSVRVHDIVASVFLRLLEQNEQVHHISHDRKDNRLDNLEIISASEHARQHTIENWANGTMDGVGEKVAKKLSKQVAQIDMDGMLVKIWPSTQECQRNGFDQSNVSNCCNGKRKSHKGFRWQWYV